MRPHPRIRKVVKWGGLATCAVLMAVGVLCRPGWTLNTDPSHTAHIPSWLPFLLAALPTAFSWRLDALATRRAKAGKCPACSYDRAGLARTAPCPECGKTP